MTPVGDTSAEGPRSSVVPRVLGLLALAVLAVAFTGALLGSLRSGRWREGEGKGEVARRELARIEMVLVRARELLGERNELRSRLDAAPESSLRVTQLLNLLERDATPPAAPSLERDQVPTSEELDALELWLDGLYRRIAAGRDVESRLADLEEELAALRALAQGSPTPATPPPR